MIGFDVFIDSDLKAWVLEVNEHPSLNINLCLEGDKGLIKHASEVDRHIKTTVVGDAIKLMKKYHAEQRSEIEAYRGWRRILPDYSEQKLSLFADVKTVFDSLLGCTSAVQNGTISLTSQQFCKLAKSKGMPDRTQLELLFVKVSKAHKMSMDNFIEALYQLASAQSITLSDLIKNFM